MDIRTYAEANWHSLSIDEVLNALGTSVSGLSSTEARARLAKFGANELMAARRVSPLKIFLVNSGAF